jgi:MinD superfamily P-loop ATPase
MKKNSANIVIASGKGGVGKSMISSSLAILFSKEKKIVVVDCDVDTQNLGIWLGIKEMAKGKTLSVSETAEIDKSKCIMCGKCSSICRYSAIEKKNKHLEVNPFLCEGCGACDIVCPVGAIKMHKVENAVKQNAKTSFGFDVIGAQLFPGKTGSGKIVAELRAEAEKLDKELIILDSPAGIGCPVTASITNTKYAILVTEPTPSGLSDLKRILLVVNHFGIPFGVIINKWDLNRDFSKKIEDFTGKNLIGKISYDKKVVESLVNMKPIIKSDSIVAKEIKKIFSEIKSRIGDVN